MADHDIPAPTLPPYYDGLGFPLERLHADDFEKFVFGCLLCVEDVLGLQITGKPSGSGDGGFDIQGAVVASGRLACVQCKRQKQPLGYDQLTKELAKVAATAALEGSDIGEHRFICTGGIRAKVINALRRESRQELATDAGNQLVTAADGELAKLRIRLEERGDVPRVVAESYVLGLDLIAAWNSQAFDAALSPRWNDVLQVADRFFRISTVVRENPRIAFDRAKYFAEYCEFKAVIAPRLHNIALPTGMKVGTVANISSGEEVNQIGIKSIVDFLQLKAGDLALLLGQGGSGKSTALALIRAAAMQSNSDSCLPILVSLASYVPGALDRLILQELGTDHGTWRSLPDDVLLLCDGLNECSHANAAAFLDEIRLLLKRKRITCIISSRESTRLTNIILPQHPLICVKVQGVSPIAIWRIAQNGLDRADVDPFVKTYTSLAENSRSSLLWTPFAVVVALGVWRLRSAVPATLGEMIETLLQSRSIRDADLPQHGMYSNIVLRLAGALAFQSLFIDQRLQYSQDEAGKWIREAKTHCHDALGVAEIVDTEVVRLLASHELLKISDNGHIGFGHQLLAGSLAAASLAKVWRNHLESLGESIADDAWVFAARLVARNQMTDFLKAVLDADLILGARAARELPDDLQVIAENLLGTSIALGAPEAVRHQGLFALARLGTPGAVSRLKAATADTRSSTNYSALRALASTGDPVYLRSLLPKIDRLRSVPMKISGGEVAIWETAPYSARLSLARERLSECAPGDPVGESLSLVAYEADANDSTVVERHLQAASDLTAFQKALYALHATAPLRAKVVFDDTLSEVVEPHLKATVLRMAAGIGIEIDMRMAFECAVSEVTSSKPDNHPEFALQQLISDVIKNTELPADLVSIVERDLPVDVSSRKTRLWQMAHRCDSDLISAYALSCIRNWTSERGSACNYFIGKLDFSRARKDILLLLCEEGLKDEKSWYDWNTSRVLALVGALGFTAKAAQTFSAMLKRLARIRQAVESKDTSCLSLLDVEALASIKSEHMSIHLGGLAAQLIPAVSQARLLLPEQDLLLLLPFNTNSYEGVIENHREILSTVSDDTVDGVLSSLDDDWTRVSGLLVASNRPPTSTRIALLRVGLLTFYAHPAGLNIVSRAIENCWCQEVFDMVVEAVADIPSWSEQETQFFWDFFRMVSRFLTTDDLLLLDLAIPKARTDFGKNILQIWRDHASGERIGLSMLSIAI